MYKIVTLFNVDLIEMHMLVTEIRINVMYDKVIAKLGLLNGGNRPDSRGGYTPLTNLLLRGRLAGGSGHTVFSGVLQKHLVHNFMRLEWFCFTGICN